MSILARRWATYFGASATWASRSVLYGSIFQDFETNLLAVGFTQTADAGQLSSFTGISAPANGDVTHGHRVYAFNDASFGTSALYLKVTYKSGYGRIPMLAFELGPTIGGSNSVFCNTSFSNSSTSDQGQYMVGGSVYSYLVFDPVTGFLAVGFLPSSMTLSTSYTTYRLGSYIDATVSQYLCVIGRGTDTTGLVKTDRVFAGNFGFRNLTAAASPFGFYTALTQNDTRVETRIYDGDVKATQQIVDRAWAGGSKNVPVNFAYLYWDDLGLVRLRNLVGVRVGLTEAGDRVSVTTDEGVGTYLSLGGSQVLSQSEVDIVSGMYTARPTASLTALIKYDGVLT